MILVLAWCVLALVSRLLIVSCDCFSPVNGVRQTNGVRSNGVNMRAVRNKRLYSFTEARRIARGHGFESKEEFIEYDCAGAYQLPKNPEVVWETDWKGWDDFLGVPPSFDEGRQAAQTLELPSQEVYMKFVASKQMEDGELSSRLPYRPDLRYKGEWRGWSDWLGL